MKIFYTGSDIEELAASGVTRLELSPHVHITDVARELAEQLGIELTVQGAEPPAPRGPAAAPASVAAAAPLGAKPRGCQHPAAPGSNGPVRPAAQPQQGDGVVNKLVNIVSRLAERGE